jgi:hypothetical protein
LARLSIEPGQQQEETLSVNEEMKEESIVVAKKKSKKGKPLASKDGPASSLRSRIKQY